MGTVVVLGYRKGLDRALARRGLDVFHVVAKVKSALEDRPYRLVAGLEDAQEVLRAVLAAELRDVVGVVTTHEEAVFSAELVREHFGVSVGGSPATALRFRDKYLQKTALPETVRRARCRYLAADSSFEEVAGELGTPFIVKPSNGAGSVRTVRVGTEEEFRRYLKENPPLTGASLVAESFMTGREIHADGVWAGGRVRWFSIGGYHESPIAWNSGGVLADQTLSREEHPELFRRAGELLAESLGALGTPDCVFHLEAFDDGQDALVFSECGLRLAGAHVPEVVELTYGINLYEAVAAVALGEPLQPLLEPAGRPASPEQYYGFVYLRRFEGVPLTRADFEQRFPIVELDFPDGDDVRERIYGRVGHAVVAAPDGERLTRLIADLVSSNRFGSTGSGSTGSADA
ncbi:acetyl-CoA carboxylase biotin carboxylase subunit family protein [Streptacidiphilus sp. EB129]|uniref:ATP-grasp domain-containing protein n=1 Tax=Streptacidiphilus sp. EB129 TaxID=3156262 RepID=UPI00351999A5